MLIDQLDRKREEVLRRTLKARARVDTARAEVEAALAERTARR